jgi:hypothetical protein
MAPGQTAEIKLADERFDALMQGLPEIGYSGGGDGVNLRIDSVIFEDGTMWRAGKFLQRDSSNSSLWVTPELAKVKQTDPSRTRFADALLSPDAKVRPGSGIGASSYKSKPTTFRRFFSHASFEDSPCHDSLEAHMSVSCGDNTNCTYSSDFLDPYTGGPYYGASASSLCKNGTTSCNVWKSATIANACNGPGYGGGGGGGLEGGGGDCMSNFDCDFGFSCDQMSGTCRDDGGFGGLR